MTPVFIGKNTLKAKKDETWLDGCLVNKKDKLFFFIKLEFSKVTLKIKAILFQTFVFN